MTLVGDLIYVEEWCNMDLGWGYVPDVPWLRQKGREP